MNINIKYSLTYYIAEVCLYIGRALCGFVSFILLCVDSICIEKIRYGDV